MHNATIAIIVFFSFSILEPEAWAEKKKDLYKTLLIVTSESKVDRKKREKRLRYIIPRMAKLCEDCKDGWDVGDAGSRRICGRIMDELQAWRKIFTRRLQQFVQSPRNHYGLCICAFVQDVRNHRSYRGQCCRMATVGTGRCAASGNPTIPVRNVGTVGTADCV